MESTNLPAVDDAQLFRTMVPASELKPETLVYLKNWKPPRGAYVLFEKRQIHMGTNMEYRLGTGLMTLNLEARPEQESKLHYYVFKKRYRIIHYGNFPKLNDPDPSRARKALMYSGANGANPWDAMESTIRGMMTSNPNWREEKTKYENDMAALRAKLAAAEARLEITNKQETTNGDQNKRSQSEGRRTN